MPTIVSPATENRKPISFPGKGFAKQANPAVSYLSLQSYQAQIDQEFVESAISPSFKVKVVSNTEIGDGGDCFDPIATALNFPRKQGGFSQRDTLYGAIFPNEDGSVWQVKLSRSLEIGKKPYLAPKGNGSRIFLPAIPREIRLKIADRYGVEVPLEGSFWDWLYYHPEVPVIITEGGKKALSLLSQGYVAIALYGANAGYQVKDPATGLPLCSKRLHPDLLPLCTGNRKVTIAFDKDDKLTTVRRVAAATGIMGKLLTAQKCKVFVAVWSKAEGKGIDDAIAFYSESAEAWLQVTIDQAPKLEHWQKKERIAQLMQQMGWLNANSHKPERTTEGRYIPTLPAVQPKAIHCLQSTGTNDGKTTRVVADWIAPNKAIGFTLILTPTNALGRQIAGDANFPHSGDYHLSDPDQWDLFWADANHRGGAVLCFDSLHHVPEWVAKKINLLILDEANQGIAHLCQGGTLQERQSDILQLFSKFATATIANDGAIVASEVTVYDRTINFLKRVSGAERVRVFDHNRTEFTPWEVEIYTGSHSGFIRDAVATLKEGKRLVLATTSQALAEKIERLVKEQCPEKKIIRVDSKTNDRGELNELTDTPDEFLSRERPDLFIYTPSLKSGVSITAPVFDQVWGYFPNGTPDGWMQAIGRYRLPVPRKCFLADYVCPSSGFEAVCSVSNSKRKRAASVNAYANAHNVNLESMVDAAEAGEDASAIAIIEAAVGDFLDLEDTANGTQKQIASHYFMHLMAKQGHNLKSFRSDKCEATQEALKRIQDDIWKEDAAIAVELNEGCLFDPECPTWHKELYRLKVQATLEFPGIDWGEHTFYEAITRDYAKLKRGAIMHSMIEDAEGSKAIEAVLVRAVLNRTIKLPHQLPKNAMKAAILRACGILNLLNVESYGNDSEVAQEVKAQALKWSKEIWFFFQINIQESQTPVAICNKLMKKIGLEACEVGRAGSGDRLRAWAVLDATPEREALRERLLNASRRRLLEAHPSVVDALAMVRQVFEDENKEGLETLRLVISSLPQPEQAAILANLTDEQVCFINGEW